MGMESDQTDKITYDICYGGATTKLTSSFEKYTDCKPIKVNINLVEGWVAMVTTHVAMKTFNFRTQTGYF